MFFAQSRTEESELFARNPDRQEKGRWVSKDASGRLVAPAETTHYQTRFSTTYGNTEPLGRAAMHQGKSLMNWVAHLSVTRFRDSRVRGGAELTR